MKDGLGTFLKDNAMQIMGMAVLVVNLWLATKLAPLAAGIESNRYRITAIESDYERASAANTGFSHITTRLDKIDTKLDRLEDKIDNLK